MTAPTLRAPLTATAADLPPAVAAALADPVPGRPGSVRAAGVEVGFLEWAASGRAAAAPGTGTAPIGTLLLLHGITNASSGWWRIAPALAASARRVIALDGPGHGRTPWTGGHAFDATAAFYAQVAAALGLGGGSAGEAPGEARSLGVIGHSWGSMAAAWLPARGLRAGRIVLLDPPALTDLERQALVDDVAEEVPPSDGELRAQVAAEHPDWDPRDVDVKTAQLRTFSVGDVLRIGAENRWDGGLEALDAVAAATPPYPLERYRVVRGIPALGGMLPDAVAGALAARIGTANLLTIGGAEHSPQRTHPEALTLAFLRALV